MRPVGTRPVGVFDSYEPKGYAYVYRARLWVETLAGGTPSNPDVAEAWIKARAYQGDLKDKLIVEEVAKIMEERGIDENAAVDEVAKNRHLVGFKHVPTALDGLKYPHPGYPDHAGELYIEGRQMKAMLKEAASVAADVDKIKARGYGAISSRKGVQSFIAEHVFVREQQLYLGVKAPTDVHIAFIHTFRGNGIQYVEVVEGAQIDFTIESDKAFNEEFWAMLFLTGQRQGIGACRSQSYGRFVIEQWTPLSAKAKAIAKNGRRNGQSTEQED